LNVRVNKNGRVKIDHINFVFEGDSSALKEKLLKRSMKETKEKRWWRVFKSSKIIEENYEDDKMNILARYNSKGYRNARILSDSIYSVGQDLVGIDIKISEGNQFYFGDITWSGNTKYRTGQLDSILKINKGDV
ncbi:MAG: POTRA domain-containing protein, partial [Bacteroidota bacterium]